MYFQDLDAQQAYWLTYDTVLDDWTRSYLGTEPKTAASVVTSPAKSKYNSGYTFAAEAPAKVIPHYQPNATSRYACRRSADSHV